MRGLTSGTVPDRRSAGAGAEPFPRLPRRPSTYHPVYPSQPEL
jgi:hypothetical protein